VLGELREPPQWHRVDVARGDDQLVVQGRHLLAAGRTVDGDRGAGASMRVMGTAFATGHAAGVAAALTAGGKDARPAAVREELNRQDARLPEPVSRHLQTRAAAA
jgi:FAD dependent oxidoreductase